MFLQFLHAGGAMNLDQLWQEFFSEPSQPWDNRFEKNRPSSPAFRHKCTKEALWIDGWSNPAWVEELAAMEQGRAQSGDGPYVNVHPGAVGQEYNGVAGWDHAKTFVGHQTGIRARTSTISSVFGTEPREGVNKSSLGTSAHTRTLCKTGQLKDAVHLLNKGGIHADSNIYICILQECINMKDLEKAKQVHAHMVQSGFKPNIFLLNTLINMYVKCGSMVDARHVFDKMPERGLFTWTIIMGGYAKHGHAGEALKIYEQMQWEGVIPDRVTFICVLNACASLGSLDKGKGVHADIIKARIAPYINLENTLVGMYAKCGSMKDARQVFDNMAQRDVVSWSAMIAGYAQHGHGREAFEIYEQMLLAGVAPNKVTFIGVLNACATLGALKRGREVHSNIIKAGIASYVNLDNTLIGMYAKCRSMEDARQVFNNMAQRDVFSWNTMISGYAQHGYCEEAIQVYEQMQQERVKPDKVTFNCVLSACANLGALEKGQEVHAAIRKRGIVPEIILENTLVDMYAKCGSMKDARQVFELMGQRDVVSWNVMIAGYAQHGYGEEAMKIYEQMHQEGIMPDKVTFSSVLSACASLGALEKGKEIHAAIRKGGIAPDIILENTLVDMYAKCGSVKDAREVFNNMGQRDVVSWNAVITGYAQHGWGREVLQLFEQMQQEGLKPDSITFVSLLSACSHVGLVHEGCHYFDSMNRYHKLTPTVEHFGCMVDLLGRAGRLGEAEDLINNMPIESDARAWRALLSACRSNRDVEIAERAAKNILERDPQDATAYVMLSNIYAVVGRWDDQEKVRKLMEVTGVRKEAGRSCIEVDNQVQTFFVADKLHPIPPSYHHCE